MEYHITQYDLEQGALEIQYIEEFFGEFPRKKTASEIIGRLGGRVHLILLATAPLPDDPGTVVPVSFKVAHEIKVPSASRSWPISSIASATTSSSRAGACSIPGSAAPGATGAARALPRAHRAAGVLGDRAPLQRNCGQDQEQVLRHARHARPSAVGGCEYERHGADNAESKVYLSKKLLPR